MKLKLLGKSGLRVSELSLGTMTFGEDWGWGASKAVSKTVFDEYSKIGGNFIDTSCNYTSGTSEKFIGEFIQGDRDRYVIATKYTLIDNLEKDKTDPNAGGNHKKNLMRSVKKSLERLQTDYIDVLYLHMWDFTTPIREVMRSLDNLVKMNLVHHIAISDTPAWIVARANTIAENYGWSELIAFQFPYSLRGRDSERTIIPLCRELEIGMPVWGVLDSGLYTGKYTRRKNALGRLTEDKWGIPSEERLKIAKEVDIIADELNCSSSQVAIAWVRQQHHQIIPILGVTNLEQLKDNLGSLEVKLEKVHFERIDEVVDFNIGFPYGFLQGNKRLYHGDTYENLINHRLQ
jgi:aryl-alcohol dehydrogenase-like predicted oxidoreductase